MLLGFVVAGLFRALLPGDMIAKHMGGRGIKGIVTASALGIPVPLCSCGVLPAAAGLRKQGAGRGPVASFLISTPETGVDSIAVTYALLDPLMTVIRPWFLLLLRLRQVFLWLFLNGLRSLCRCSRSRTSYRLLLWRHLFKQRCHTRSAAIFYREGSWRVAFRIF